MTTTKCKVCLAPNQNELEDIGMKGVRGEISWRAAGRDAGLGTNFNSLKNHMERHYTERTEREVTDEMQSYIEQSVKELQSQFLIAPPEVKPLILAAIHNVRELQTTKASQQHLIQALKTIQEMTGMKQEQRMMLLFAERMFPEVKAPTDAPAIGPGAVIDVEEV